METETNKKNSKVQLIQQQQITDFQDWVFDTHFTRIEVEGFEAQKLYLMGCSKDGQIKVYDPENIEQNQGNLNSFSSATKALHRIVSFQGKQFYFSTGEGYILRLSGQNLQDQKCIKAHSSSLTGLYIDKQQKQLYSCGFDCKINVLDLETEKITHNYNILLPGGQVQGNGNHVFAASGLSDVIQIYDDRVKREIKKLIGHSQCIVKLKFINNKDFPNQGTNNYLFTGSHDKKCFMWDWVQGKVIKEFKGHEGTIFGIDYCKEKDLVFTSSWDSNVRVFDYYSQNQLLNIEGHTDKVISCSWDQENRLLATSGRDNSILVNKLQVQ